MKREETSEGIGSDMKDEKNRIFPIKSKERCDHSDSRSSKEVNGIEKNAIQNSPLRKNLAVSSVFILDNVILPLLESTILSSKSNEPASLRSSLHHTYAKKFVSRVCRFDEQEDQRIILPIPEGLDEHSASSLTDDTALMERVDETSNIWYSMINEILENELKQDRLSNGPIGELDFWRRRHVILSAVLNQVSSAKGQLFLKAIASMEVLEPVSSRLKVTEKIQHLTKLGVEAAENAKFLSTLERHLRILSDSSLTTIIQTIPSLMDSMRMVWTVSRYYNREERMVPLMERVASQIVTRVKHQVKLQNIMNQENSYMQQIVRDCKYLLQSWRISYMKVRSCIEEGAGVRRWEFERGRLFDETDYMADICSELLGILNVVNQFQNFLGLELASVTGEASIVNAVVMKIQALPKFFQSFHFDPFDRAKRVEWRHKIDGFNLEVKKIEESVGWAIECAFQQLRSSEMAFHLVMKFKGLKSRPLIHQIVEKRFQDILGHYAKELDQISSFFKNNKEKPPIIIGQQRMAGRIAWANDLFHRAKVPIVLFQSESGSFEDELGCTVKRDYLKFAHTIDAYKDELFKEWVSVLLIESYDGLRNPLLRREKRLSVTSFEDNSVCERPLHLLTNFCTALITSTHEAKQFHGMGYKLPEAALHLILHENMYHW